MKQKPPKIRLDNKERASRIFELLTKEYPDAKTALNHSNPLELLVATILSAQCTDKRVNMVTETLFKKYRTAKEYADSNISTLQQEIRSTGFYRNKAMNIKKMSQVLVDKFDSKVPKTMGEMLELPGVARKTANIVLSNAYGVVEGIAVDTHVRRTTQRLGLTENKDPDKIEQDLLALFSKDRWMKITDLLISLGRNVCTAKKPKCEICVLNEICPSAFTFGRAPKSTIRNGGTQIMNP